MRRLTRREACQLALLAGTGMPGLCGGAATVGTAGAVVSLQAPARLARVQDTPAGLLAISRGGELWQLDRGRWNLAGHGLHSASLLAIGDGRVAGRGLDGTLWMLENGRVTTSPNTALAPDAGLLLLEASVLGVTPTPQGGHLLARLERRGGAWVETARSRDAVLPDARPVLFETAAASDVGAGQVAVLGGPSETRYHHGVLGDAVEATSLLLIDRHSLKTLAKLELPDPFVFEDIAPRPVAWRGRPALLTVRSGPLGAQLAVVTLDSALAGRLQLAQLGPSLGQPRRWMSPTTDGKHLCAVHTPHIGGVLHCYEDKGGDLRATRRIGDVSNHVIGRRDLDTSVWLERHWVVPAQDQRRLRFIEVAPGGTAAAPEIELGQAVAGLCRWTHTGKPGVAVLLEDGSLVWTAAP
ncbi:MAG: hypothetical protein V4731_16090 [Pseudomonadota bacterium]